MMGVVLCTVEQLLTIAKEKKASDVHVTVGLPPRVRINGELVDLEYPKLTPADCEKLILDIMDERQENLFKDRGELDFSFSIPNIGRYRVNVFRQRGSVACAMRIVGTEFLHRKVLAYLSLLLTYIPRREDLC